MQNECSREMTLEWHPAGRPAGTRDGACGWQFTQLDELSRARADSYPFTTATTDTLAVATLAEAAMGMGGHRCEGLTKMGLRHFQCRYSTACRQKRLKNVSSRF